MFPDYSLRFIHPLVHPRSMSLSQQHTVGVVTNHYPHDDEDDNDICPVCDGECTCEKNSFPRGPISMNDYARYQPSTSLTPLPKPTLKIKLTVPQGMLAKRRATIPAETTSTNDNDQEDEDDDCASSSTSSLTPVKQPPPPPKRRGRPPKSAISARNAVSNQIAHPSSPTPNHLIKRKNVFVRHKKLPARSRLTKDNQSSATAAVAIKRKVAARKRRAAEHVETADSTDTYDDDDNEYDHFPTFVSASALSSFSSCDSDTSSIDQSDSDIEAEEERFIIAEVRDKARVRRELFGDDVQMRRDPHNNWVIRPRKKSVGLSDDEMDVDSDATEEDEQNGDDEEDEDEEDEETDGKKPGNDCIGLVTGWSDDEESSFDADLFFANLTDLGSSTSSDDDQADHSDIDSVSVDVNDLLPHLRRGLENLPFEVTESWDGQIVFTNGLREGQGLLDIDFEIEAAQFMAESSTPTPGDTDVEMMHSDVDDGGYEEDADGGEGDTTDEELVGEDDLPNERAMRLFNFPLSVSAINPMSTVSPGPRTRWSPATKETFDSPKPADILAGRVFWDSDDPEDAGRGLASSKGAGPRTGSFVPNEGIRNAIIDEKHQEIPSPHPNFRRSKGKSAGRSSISSHNLCEQALMASIASSPVVDRSSPFISSEDNGSLPPETPYEKPIELNDVLEASFLDPDPSEATGDSDTMPFDKWDLVSVGAFRQTRETGTAVTEGVSSWQPSSPTDTITDYGKLVKPRPLNAMLWQNRNQGSSPRQARGRRVIMDISPVILPRDGDQTPTNVHHNNYDLHQPQKSRKELRRERKLKRKSAGPVRQQHQHRHQNQHQQHYHHHHYPNMKSRSLASVQRTNFASSSVPPLSL